MNHLKRSFICAFTATMLCAPMQAQTTKAELSAHMELATGNYCNYPLPKGTVMNENETSIPIPTDCYPFYHWKDVSAYYRNILKQANVTYKNENSD